jgi:hypothetical protein
MCGTDRGPNYCRKCKTHFKKYEARIVVTVSLKAPSKEEACKYIEEEKIYYENRDPKVIEIQEVERFPEPLC